MTITFTLSEIKKAAEEVLKLSNGKKVWAIHGEMGAGKTTFIHAVCENLGVTSTIGSPTYSIINEYKSDKAGEIYHMDWYRLRDEEEALQAGVEDYLFNGHLCFVEWPQKAPALLPDDCLHLTIKITGEESREVLVS